jgi:hypothetical protein
MELHRKYIADGLADSRGASGPSQLPAVEFRAFEPCEVKDVRYIITGEGADLLTVLRATLQLLDCDGARVSARAKQFCVDIPPPLCSFSEFVLERGRFEAAAAPPHPVGTAVKSCMLDGHGTMSTEWYNGVVDADKLAGRTVPLRELYDTPGVVERYTVRMLRAS